MTRRDMWPALLLAACTGVEPDTSETDADEDGFTAQYDCDDSNPQVYPTADEVCDGIDNNCDAIIDDAAAADAATWYADGDGDGYGNPAASTTGCTPPPGFIGEAGDCDDADASASPGLDEVCDGIDNDCDGSADNDPVDAATWYQDQDGDGFGTDNSAREGCPPDQTWVRDSGDCDDGTSAVYPGAGETCGDGTVNDCNSTLDGARAACAWPGVLRASNADAELDPSGTSGQPGWAIAHGDLNADGQDDLLLGSPGSDQAWMMFGPISTDRSVGSGAALSGTVPGLSVLAADVNGDGYDDVLTGSGSSAWVLWGPVTAGASLSGADLIIEEEGAALAVLGAGVGGAPLLAVGAPGEGAVYLFSGNADGTGNRDDAPSLSGASNTGATLSTAGDINGDGVDELLIGAPSASNGGAAWLVQGPITASVTLTSSERWTATGWSSLMGTALAALGDLNDDGYPDFALGAPAADIYSGAVGIWYGAATLPAPEDITGADVTIVGNTGFLFGGDVGPAGDIDLDGRPDVVIGSGYGVPSGGSAPVDDGPAEAYLFLSSGTLAGSSSLNVDDADVRFEGPQRAFGLRAAGVGDISGDGRNDLFFSSGEVGEESYLFFGPGE